MEHIRITGTEPSSVILYENNRSKMNDVRINPNNYNFIFNFFFIFGGFLFLRGCLEFSEHWYTCFLRDAFISLWIQLHDTGFRSLWRTFEKDNTIYLDLTGVFKNHTKCLLGWNLKQIAGVHSYPNYLKLYTVKFADAERVPDAFKVVHCVFNFEHSYSIYSPQCSILNVWMFNIEHRHIKFSALNST